MKKIIFDLSQAKPYKKIKNHGGAIYSIELLKYLHENLKEFKFEVIIYKNQNKPKFSKRISFFEVDSNKEVFKKFDKENVEENIIFIPIPYFLKNKKKKLNKAKIFITIHGLRNMEILNYNYSHKYKINPIKKAYNLYQNKIIPRSIKKRLILKTYKQILKPLTKVSVLTDSKHSAKLIKDNIRHKNLNILVVYPRINFQINKKELSKIEKNYILLISTNRSEKNVLRYLESLENSDFNKKYPKLKIILVGTDKITEKLINKKFKKLKIIFKRYVSKKELIKLYSESRLFVYPSLSEGFGYPILEALSLGKKVLTSKISCIPEIGGKVCFLFRSS